MVVEDEIRQEIKQLQEENRRRLEETGGEDEVYFATADRITMLKEDLKNLQAGKLFKESSCVAEIADSLKGFASAQAMLIMANHECHDHGKQVACDSRGEWSRSIEHGRVTLQGILKRCLIPQVTYNGQTVEGVSVSDQGKYAAALFRYRSPDGQVKHDEFTVKLE